jgi:succinylglutamic semialdehyde dehydrogenase
VWTGSAASPADVTGEATRARAAFRPWPRTSLAGRETRLRAFAATLESRRASLTDAISREVGKPTWEALTEVTSMIGQIELSITAHPHRCADFAGAPALTRFRPLGVVTVFGPFNFPGHLPEGRIVPARFAGNTVVFKPSEHAPLMAEVMTTA